MCGRHSESYPTGEEPSMIDLPLGLRAFVTQNRKDAEELGLS